MSIKWVVIASRDIWVIGRTARARWECPESDPGGASPARPLLLSLAQAHMSGAARGRGSTSFVRHPECPDNQHCNDSNVQSGGLQQLMDTIVKR